MITFPERNTNTKYLFGEFIWYLNGSNNPKGILPYSKFWANITNSGDVDGYAEGSINSNYGNRLFGSSELPAFSGINQWDETLELFRKDKDTRQAIMNIHIPSDRHAGNKDVPCTTYLQWLIREDKLHLITNMRSNDHILGFTNDVFQFTMLQECMLLELREAYPNLELGYYFHNAGSMHIYDRHFSMAYAVIANTDQRECFMPPMDRFDAEIKAALLELKRDWELAGGDKDFNFTELHAWDHLTPYWQSLVLAFFGGYTNIIDSWVHSPVKP